MDVLRVRASAWGTAPARGIRRGRARPSYAGRCRRRILDARVHGSGPQTRPAPFRAAMTAMQPATRAPAPGRPEGSGVRPWQAVAVLAGLLAVEACLLGWLFRGWLPALPGKQWAAFILLLVFGGLRSHLLENRDDYRSVRVRWPLVACQGLCFAALLTLLQRLEPGAAETVAGWFWPAAIAAAVAWTAASVLLIAPRPELAGRFLGTAAVLALLAAAAWRVGDLTRTFWHFSGGTTVRLVELLLGPFAGGPVVRPEPFVIGTPEFQVEINDPCSGFHGIGLITTLLSGYLWWFRRLHRFPQSLVLIPVGILAMWLANVVRITALILVGVWISPAIAVDGFHSAAGWIAFLSVGLGIVWAASRSPFFSTAEGLPASDPSQQTTAVDHAAGVDAVADDAAADDSAAAWLPITACLLPFLALTGVTMLTRAFTAGFDVLYPVRVIVVAAMLWHLRGDLRRQVCGVAPAAVAIGVVTFVLWMILTRAAAAWSAGPGPLAAAHPAVDPLELDPVVLGEPWTTLWLLFRVIGSTITVPIAEELFFRGFVIRRCIAADADAVPVGQFSWFSFLVSSVAFGLLHGEAWLAGIVAGMLFAVALYARRRLIDAVAAHATTNALLTGYVIATGSWSEWG
ncbi:MAG: exosortase E/protease, VPEID-CTERM system [Planctomycetia bacterium]|nr:exosortase E/protease, VPEID-CTERM system [Planctomycetia bacterium]